MNDMTTVSGTTLEKLGVDRDTYLTLKSSIFPGARDESIALAISYCKAAKLDILQKPVHLVPLSVKNEHGKYEYRDVVMPGITLYRIQASRSGLCAGVEEPEFGPMIESTIQGVRVIHPEWCKVTVKKLVNNHVCDFSAKEIWLENFASNKEGKPNMMWVKRPFGQLAKCAESQAWRKAFPEIVGGNYTADEMEGKFEVISEKVDDKITKYTLDVLLSLADDFGADSSLRAKWLEHYHVRKFEDLTEVNANILINTIERKMIQAIDNAKPGDIGKPVNFVNGE